MTNKYMQNFVPDSYMPEDLSLTLLLLFEEAGLFPILVYLCLPLLCCSRRYRKRISPVCLFVCTGRLYAVMLASFGSKPASSVVLRALRLALAQRNNSAALCSL